MFISIEYKMAFIYFKKCTFRVKLSSIICIPRNSFSSKKTKNKFLFYKTIKTKYEGELQTVLVYLWRGHKTGGAVIKFW